MGRVKNNIVMKGTAGQINKQVVFKTYGDKTFISSYPDRSKVQYTDNQKAEQSLFAEAILFAKSIIHDPIKKAEFKAHLEPGQRVYNAAISFYLKKQKSKQD